MLSSNIVTTETEGNRLTRVVVSECRHKLQVFLHEGGLIHHGGARGGDERHGGGRDRQDCAVKGQTSVCARLSRSSCNL